MRGPRPREPLAGVVEARVSGTDADGTALARPVDWSGRDPPLIRLLPEPAGRPALAPGQRLLARVHPLGPGRYEGRTLRLLEAAPGRVLGIFRPAPGGGRIVPTDRRAKAEWVVPAGQTGGAEPGELVLAEPLPHPGAGLAPARILSCLGPGEGAAAATRIAIHAHDLPTVFPPEALAEAARARAAPRPGREDLTALPLVTIDGEDARDFDDAVFAEPQGAGFRLVVAIADVAHYVRPGSALDREARRRGNSAYFPDQVVPMLPERLSNHWCSLLPGARRPCLFAEISLDAAGEIRGHRFGRALMQSTARLTYEQAEAGRGSDPRLLPLYGAYGALAQARARRGALDLDLPERRVILDGAGGVAEVALRVRLDSHRLIEECMIAANVAAARTLGGAGAPCLYRIHAAPGDEKLAALREVLGGLGLAVPPGAAVGPGVFAAVLARAAGTPIAPLVSLLVLRAQTQAAYAAQNIGHFGLGLPAYAHFTSPIRRYADLLVHRSLIALLGLGAGGIGAEEAAALPEIGRDVTGCERRAVAAEREAFDRHLALFMADQLGARFPARISGVTRFGLFVTLHANGANGFVPAATLPPDRWMHDPTHETLSGRHSRQSFRLGDAVEVRLAEAAPLTGGLVFTLLRGGPGPDRARQGRPAEHAQPKPAQPKPGKPKHGKPKPGKPAGGKAAGKKAAKRRG